MAQRVQYSVEVNAPVDVCYGHWTDFEEFPQFMNNVERVTRKGDRRFHWEVKGPMGNVEWDAEVDNMVDNRKVSWRSLPDANNDVGIQGEVNFVEVEPFHTRITTTMQYETPAGALGEAVAGVFSDPQRMVEEDLNNFKQMVENETANRGTPSGIDTPLEKASVSTSRTEQVPPPVEPGVTPTVSPGTTSSATRPRGNTPGNTTKGWTNQP